MEINLNELNHKVDKEKGKNTINRLILERKKIEFKKLQKEFNNSLKTNEKVLINNKIFKNL